MKGLMIACSEQGYKLMKQLAQIWQREEADIRLMCRVKCSQKISIIESREEIIPDNLSLKEYVGSWFGQMDVIIFICATGIAVRCIAPYIVHKSKDPAVVVVDETGKFSISLLSGHMGRANETAEKIGNYTGAVPVITTATDCQGRFGVDVFAQQNNLMISNWKMAKQLSAHILAGSRIGICSELPMDGELPEEIVWYDWESWIKGKENSREEMGISISYRKLQVLPFIETLQLIPKILVIGIGCRKNISTDRVAKAVESCLRENELLFSAVGGMVSIDLKENEKGIFDFCSSRNIPFWTYSAEVLKRVEGSTAESDFVRQVTGVSNVCERSVLAAGGELISGKKIYDGVTIALGARKGSVKV